MNKHGDISNYYPDFVVKPSAKGLTSSKPKHRRLDVPSEDARLRQWCEDITKRKAEVTYDFVYVDEESFKKYRPGSFAGLVESFREYKELWQGAGGEG